MTSPGVRAIHEAAQFRAAAAKIRKGRNAWVITAKEQNTLPTSKSTVLDRRQRWREIGEALLEGRAMFADVSDFGEWCKAERLDVPGRTRYAAMWLALNWPVIATDLPSGLSHPEVIRRWHLASRQPQALLRGSSRDEASTGG